MPIPAPTDGSPWLAERLLVSMAVPATVPHAGLLAVHALGTFCGAAMAARLAASHSLVAALAIGFAQLSSGIANVLALEQPSWFEVADRNLACIPMAWLGWRSVRPAGRRVDATNPCHHGRR